MSFRLTTVLHHLSPRPAPPASQPLSHTLRCRRRLPCHCPGRRGCVGVLFLLFNVITYPPPPLPILLALPETTPAVLLSPPPSDD